MAQRSFAAPGSTLTTRVTALRRRVRGEALLRQPFVLVEPVYALVVHQRPAFAAKEHVQE